MVHYDIFTVDTELGSACQNIKFTFNISSYKLLKYEATMYVWTWLQKKRNDYFLGSYSEFYNLYPIQNVRSVSID